MVLHFLFLVLRCILWYCIFSYGIALYLMVVHFLLWYRIFSYGIAFSLMILLYLMAYLIVSYTILRHCIVGFGVRAVSRKTPINFI